MAEIVINVKLRQMMRSWETTADVQHDLPETLKLIVEEHDAILKVLKELGVVIKSNA